MTEAIQVEPAEQHARSPEVLSEMTETFAEMYRDPSLVSISFRRHGEYERSMDSKLRGSLTRETVPAVRSNAEAWVAQLPDEVSVDIIASPSVMPTNRADGKAIWPARARMTSAIYGAALRGRFGNGAIGLGPDELNRDYLPPRHNAPSEAVKVAHKKSAGGTVGERRADRTFGDIFEMLDPSKGHETGPFFKQLSEDYGGLTRDFWHDYERGRLPVELNRLFLENGGESAIDKVAHVLEALEVLAGGQRTDTKQADLIVSHEEVIGSLVYQMSEYLRETKTASEEAVETLGSATFSYNQGFDMHIDDKGVAAVKVGDIHFAVDIEDFGTFLAKHREALQNTK